MFNEEDFIADLSMAEVEYNEYGKIIEDILNTELKEMNKDIEDKKSNRKVAQS